MAKNRKRISKGKPRLWLSVTLAGFLVIIGYVGAYVKIPVTVPTVGSIIDVQPLTISAEIPSARIDEVVVGQSADLVFLGTVRVTALGIVEGIAVDALPAGSYPARIGLAAGETARLVTLDLRRGTPVEVFINAGSRTLLDFITHPLTSAIARSFREDGPRDGTDDPGPMIREIQ